MDYQKQVEAAAAALKRGEDANWELARLTFEVCGPAGNIGRPTGDAIPISRWADDIRMESGRPFSGKIARYYRDIWDQFGKADPDPSLRMAWSEAYAQIRGGTVAERMVSADFNRSMRNASPEFKAEAFQRLADDPVVVAEALAKPEVRQALYAGMARAEQEQEPRDEGTFGELREQILQKVAGPDGPAVLMRNLHDIDEMSRTDVKWLTDGLTVADAESIERDTPRYVEWLTQVKDEARRIARRMELVR